jgi:hypothetical protein
MTKGEMWRSQIEGWQQKLARVQGDIDREQKLLGEGLAGPDARSDVSAREHKKGRYQVLNSFRERDIRNEMKY